MTRKPNPPHKPPQVRPPAIFDPDDPTEDATNFLSTIAFGDKRGGCTLVSEGSWTGAGPTTAFENELVLR